jgi:TRAP-type C4-dicarboxylate transport system permease small subunit
VSAVRVIVRAWALVGGLVLLGLVLLTGTSVVLDLLFGRPIPGDFELVEILCAVSAFAFLPWCQLSRGHVNVDLFTTRAPPALQRGLDALGSLLMLGLALLLLWRMSLGGMSYYDPYFPERTPILGIPLWWAFPPAIVSLALWAAASLVTLVEDLRRMSGQGRS